MSFVEEMPSCIVLLAVWGGACGAPAQRGWAGGPLVGDLPGLQLWPGPMQRHYQLFF